MINKNYISRLIQNYFIIFTMIILVTALLNPTHAFTFREIMLSALFAFAGDLPSLIYYSKEELSIKSRYIRMVLHFIILEIVIMTFGNLLGLVVGMKQTILLGLEVFVIALLVSFINWLIDRKTADALNQELMKLKGNK